MDVSIIIINYNTAEYTVKCVESVIQNTDQSISYQIIVVDNNSMIQDYNLLKKSLPNGDYISLHRSNINTGFGGGNMFGNQFAKGKYLLFLNNDAMLKNDCISILKIFLETNPEIGICTAQNFDEYGKEVASFDHNKGLRKLLFGRSFLEKNFKKPKRNKTYQKPIIVDFINGAFMFFRSDAFADVGGFDTNIFLYFEEMDICHRLQKKGFKSALVPQAKILHYQGVSTGVSKTISKEGFISYLYVIKKNYSLIKYVIIKYYFCFTFLFKPKKWFLLPLVFKSVSLKESLKQKQEVTYL